MWLGQSPGLGENASRSINSSHEGESWEGEKQGSVRQESLFGMRGWKPVKMTESFRHGSDCALIGLNTLPYFVNLSFTATLEAGP